MVILTGFLLLASGVESLDAGFERALAKAKRYDLRKYSGTDISAIPIERDVKDWNPEKVVDFCVSLLHARVYGGWLSEAVGLPSLKPQLLTEIRTYKKTLHRQELECFLESDEVPGTKFSRYPNYLDSVYLSVLCLAHSTETAIAAEAPFELAMKRVRREFKGTFREESFEAMYYMDRWMRWHKVPDLRLYIAHASRYAEIVPDKKVARSIRQAIAAHKQLNLKEK